MSQPLSRPLAEMPQPRVLSPDQQAMVEACETGRLGDLQRMLKKHDFSEDSNLDGYAGASEKVPQLIRLLFASAISSGHQPIVRYLYSVYPTFEFYEGSIVQALSQRPDLEMLKLIHSYSPRIIEYEYDDHVTTLLSRACVGGPEYARFIDFLLDHGATHLDYGGFTFYFGGPLLPAIQHDQPIDVVKRMIGLTAHLWYPIFAAVERRRVDALKMLLKEEQTRNQVPRRNLAVVKQLLDAANATKDKKVIAPVARYYRHEEKRDGRAKIKKSKLTRSKSSQAAQMGKAGEVGAEYDEKLEIKPKDGERWLHFRISMKRLYERVTGIMGSLVFGPAR